MGFLDNIPTPIRWIIDAGSMGMTAIGPALEKAYNTNGPWYEQFAAGADRALDPGGAIDEIVRGVGEQLPDSVRNVAPAVGGTIGGIIGSYVPGAGTIVGAGIGAGLGSKIKGDTYTGSFINSGIAAASAYAAGSIGDWLSAPGKGVSEAAAMSAEDAAIQAMADEAAMGTAQTNASLVNTYGSLDAVPGQSVGGTLQAASGYPAMTASQWANPASFTQPEFSALTSGEPMTKVEPWYKDVLSNDNVTKALDLISPVAKALVASPNPVGASFGGGIDKGSTTLDIAPTLEHIKNLSGDTGVSRPGKASLWEEYEYKKKKDVGTFLESLKEYARQKEEEKQQYKI
jgi:hypothetical protein